MTRETRIGIFVGAAFLILAVFIFIVGDLATLFRKPGYPLSVEFASAAGLEKRAPVKMAGIKIGYGQGHPASSGRQARVVMDIDAGVKVPKDSTVTFSHGRAPRARSTSRSCPATSPEFCGPGEMLPGAMSTVGFDQIGPAARLGRRRDQVRRRRASAKRSGPETRANLGRTLENLAVADRRARGLSSAGTGAASARPSATAAKAAAALDRSVNEVSAAASTRRSADQGRWPPRTATA